MSTASTPDHWFEGSEFTHRVAQAVAQYGPISRTALAQIIGLSQGALSRITSDLIYAKVIEEVPTDHDDEGPLPLGFIAKDRTNRRGRPRTSMRLRGQQRSFVGVNLHGTALSVIVVDALCRELSECRNESLASTDPAAVVRQIAAIVEELSANIKPSPSLVGVSVGGHPFDDRDITYAPFLHWDDTVPLAAMLQKACAIPVVVANDLDALLLFESWFGAGVGIPRFALLTIGAGVGYALSEQGEPVDYPDKSYGLIGHALVDNHGPRCFAGHVGCAQCLTNASLAEEYSAAMGKAMSFEDFATDARAGKAQAQSLADTTCFRLGTLIATVENFAMPQQVFINGESSFLARLNTESIRSAINSLRPSRASKVDFTILDFSWDYWAKAAAANAIAHYLL